jgi:hypothetical protein
MLSRGLVPAPKSNSRYTKHWELCNFYLEGAFKTVDRDIALLLCHDAEVLLVPGKECRQTIP